MSANRPAKVAIIGGGCAGIAAAFELSRPQHRGKYQVTVYQLGWRLGGKGASGRGPAARIEEHGFHVWLGFYENAFRLMRECYAELNRDPARCRIATWRDAFFPAPFIGLADCTTNQSKSSFALYFPPADGLPGDPIDQHTPFSLTSYFIRAANALRTMLMTVNQRTGPAPGRPLDAPEGFALEPPAADEGATSGFDERVFRLLKLGVLTTTAGLVEGAGLVSAIVADRIPYVGRLVVRLLEAMSSTARQQAALVVASDSDLRVLWQAIDLSLTSMLGMLRFGLLSDPRGFDAINEYDFREWLGINGACADTLNSALLRGIYDLAFAYENGDYDRPRQGAGVGLRGAMRLLFSYRGSMIWKMRAGMGDIVFAPLYEVLKRRGVSFMFFHRLENLRLVAPTKLAPGERRYVEALEFDIQAEITNGGEYQPLIDLDGLPCWPSKPDCHQLIDGERIVREEWNFESYWDRRRAGTKTLKVVDDFDFVVLAIGLGGIPSVCGDLMHSDQRWRDMVANVKTVETQAFQLWSRENLDALGWPHPPVSLSGFVQPFESFADMRHLAPEERWAATPGAIVYFLSTLNDSGSPPDRSNCDYPRRRRDEVRQNAIRFLKNDIAKIWPGVADRQGEFRWELLMDPIDGEAPDDAKGESRFDSQFWQANIDPSERYVISVPGSQKYRISPLDNTYDNLTIAGDWTACGMDSGCVEAAVMSGRLAAHALSSLPALEEIVAYDHP
jgi:uncharacterized protein with NAD-binding domain and iron-sulfur cluster